MIKKKYQKVEANDYSDCGFPIAHLERDLYFTYLALLEDEQMRKKSFLSKKDYTKIVNDYYSKMMKEFKKEYYSR